MPTLRDSICFGGKSGIVDKLVVAMQTVLANDDNLKVDLEFEMEDQPSEEPEK